MQLQKSREATPDKRVNRDEHERRLTMLAQPALKMPELSDKEEDDGPTAVLKKFKKQNNLKQQLDSEQDPMMAAIDCELKRINREVTRENMEFETL